MKAKVEEVVIAMGVLLTRRQIAAVEARTRGGGSKLEVLRRIVNAGIGVLEAEAARRDALSASLEGAIEEELLSWPKESPVSQGERGFER